MVLLPIPLDLHVLSLQLAFILSQDQTLHSSSLLPRLTSKVFTYRLGSSVCFILAPSVILSVTWFWILDFWFWIPDWDNLNPNPQSANPQSKIEFLGGTKIGNRHPTSETQLACRLTSHDFSYILPAIKITNLPQITDIAALSSLSMNVSLWYQKP